eukprot:TRINITY_DN424_c0_g1_i2.p1 TRINITY_DN424_c0_g1~~TRINITY_DN424_c0_g1_i2.p1  ORF type:complete len:1158 (+),score=312.59 TRINITY_DN424_c0_g1_i2:262-3735(+)
MANKQGGGQSSKTVARQGVDDMVMLSQVTEESIVDNIRKRYENDLIYTYIGPVLISVNPYKNLQNSGNHLVPMYHGHFPHENPPHLYALAEEAYRAMKGEGENQCVLISGESGAGKTEAAKIIMGYVSFVTGSSDRVEYVKNVVLESNPVLEAFGNAKTLRNNNSSRFGKYFEIQFDAMGDPCGGKITNYLLEKSRVVYQQGGERNFHFFYNLLAGASDQDARNLQLYTADNFFYVNQGQAYTVDGIDDVQDYQDVRNAMNVVGMSAQEQSSLLQLVAGILHMGNVSFREDRKGGASVEDPGVFQLASSLLGVDPATLTNALVFRTIQTGGTGQSNRSSTYNVPQNASQANGAKDALSREIYFRLFDWIVLKINTALNKYKAPFKSVIGILDIYGFEIFQHNGFEQFCINYVNEKLQQYFIELTLKAEQEEYVKEGIKWTPIKYFNNAIVCELIEGKIGVFGLLDDICYTIHAQTGSGTDTRFLEKCSGLFGQHPHFRAFNGAFQVKHYAGDVSYEVEGFSDKNKDTLFGDVIQALQCSSNQFLVSLFPEDVATPQKKRPTTAGYKIKTSCGALMTALSACSPHYVRCIKPNDEKKYHAWDVPRVTHQVKYLGLLENVRVRRAGFAYRAPFERFVNRYKKLSKNTWGIWGEWTGSAIQGCETICRDLQLEAGQWQMGKTKIFIRHPETLFFLEEQVERKDFDCASKIQKAWKKWKLAKRALEQRAYIANIFRGQKERQRYSVNRNYIGDYMNYDCNYALQDLIRQHSGQEGVIFSDQIVKLNRRNKPERRDFVITDQAFYIVARALKDNRPFYKLTRRTALADIERLSLSTLQDNYIVMHIPREYDNLMENDKKTEMVAILLEYYQALTGRQLPIQFTDRVQYKIKSGDTRELQFTRNESAQTAQLKKAGKTLRVEISSGLPKDTDSTPQGLYQRAQGGGGPPRGGGAARGRGGQPPRGGGGAPRGGGGQPQPQQAQQPARGGAVAPQQQRGGAMSQPQRGGGSAAPARGGGPATNGGAGPAAQRGGPAAARGGPGTGGPQRGGPAQVGGGGQPGRGGPAQGGGQRGGAAAAQQQPARGGGMPGRGGGRGGGAAPPPGRSQQPSCTAQFDYEAQTPDELSFREGDSILIHQKDPGGWWEGELNGKRGWVPANYVKEN